MTSKFIPLSLMVSVLALSACASGGTKSTTQKPASSMNTTLKTSSIDRVMERALADAEANGNKQEILATLEQVHARNPKDPIVATRYARALRDDDQINASIRVLKPFSDGPDKNIEAVTEMAMTQLSLGDFAQAESYAETAVDMNPKNARAFLAMGTAEDAQSKHQEAEVSFRKGLKHWKGDPAPIMNNLALNLASQGHLEESLSLIEKAQKLSPGRMDLERNRRIIATLLETTDPRPPSPVGKPKVTLAPKPAPVVKAKPTPTPKPAPVKVERTGDAKILNLNPKPQPVKVETKKAVEKKIDKIVEDEKMKVNVNGGTKLKTNIKLKPLN